MEAIISRAASDRRSWLSLEPIGRPVGRERHRPRANKTDTRRGVTAVPGIRSSCMVLS